MSKGSLYLRRKGGIQMTAHDTILNLVDRLIAEKEKNILLQLELQQKQQDVVKKTDKD